MKWKKVMHRKIKRLWMLYIGMLLLFCVGCTQKEEKSTGTLLPEILRNQTFIYDELETGEGNGLFTLMFTDTGYRLYQDQGIGVLAEGNVNAEADKTLVFESSDGTFEGQYTGSAFETPSVTIDFNGENRTMQPDTESGEYVYLAYLGIYEGKMKEQPVSLILDRWFEFYLYSGKTLIRGNYEIYADGQVKLTTLDGDVLNGSVLKDEDIGFVLDGKAEDLKLNQVSMTRAKAKASYQAEHAMGTYTLAFYEGNLFTIHGIDGYVKAMGSVIYDGENSRVTYFPREITDNVEADDKFTISFDYEEDVVLFPASTYLLPRSGNIDEETGYASYWSAGTALEFRRNAENGIQTEILYDVQEKDPTNVPIATLFGKEMRMLNQTMPSVGTAKPLVLLIEFPDYKRPRFITAKDIEYAIFDVENPESLSAYYYRESYGQLTIDGTVLDWYCTQKNRSEYATDKEIMEEAVNYYRAQGLNLTDFDADGDGVLDSLYVLWAGNMDNSSNTWSGAYRSTWYHSPETWEVKADGYIFVPGSTVWSSVPPLVCNINSLTHETGHLLGLNDYYSYDTSERTDESIAYTGGALEGGMGGMDMMDANIGSQNAFSKWLLGWLEPEVIEYEQIEELRTGKKRYTLRPSNEYGDALFVKLKSSENLCTEMLVIEVIRPTQNASEFTRLKEPVVRILHVDASLNEEGMNGNWRGFGFKNDNSYTSTKFISILEADGQDDILNFYPQISGSKISYDVQDYFTEGDIISPNSYPNTNGYDAYGNATVYNGLSISIESIDDEGTAVISLEYEEKEESLSLLSVTPEPMIVPYEKDKMMLIPRDTKEMTWTFDEKIEFVDDEQIEKIQVLSSNQRLEKDSENFEVVLRDSELSIVFTEDLKPNTDYTVVIPQGVVKSSVYPNRINNFNSIFGFVTEE